ncbi:MAG: hypothetical protein KC656_08845, partial [Myxococcales bacterium]|nr:hypothetical protein [Myxococcales bacterium]
MLALLTAVHAQPIYLPGGGCRGPATVRPIPLADLRRHITAELRAAGLELHVVHDGVSERVLPRRDGAAKLSDLSREALVVVGCAVNRDRSESEVDWIKENREGQVVPLTVWEDEGRLTVAEGPPVPPLREASRGDVASRFGLQLDRDGDAEWSPRLAAGVEEALQTLAPEELEVVRAVPFQRSDAEPPMSWMGNPAAAAYRRDGPERAFLLYDTVVTARGGFVGSVTSPHHPAVHTIVHEMGHALDDHPAWSGQLADDRRPAQRLVEEVGPVAVTA